MTEDKKPGSSPPPDEGVEDEPRSTSRGGSLHAQPVFEDEESSTRSTVASIAIPTSPRERGKRAVLMVGSGPSTGRTASIEGDTVLGRGRDSTLRLDDAGASRAHACVRRLSDGQYELEDLGSLNGTYVNGRRIERVILQSGDRIHIGPNIVVTFAILDSQAERIAQQLYESSIRDALTRAHNRRYLIERLPSEVAYALRHGTLLSLILLDVDHFKRVNDTLGHLAGDDVLRDLAALVQRMIRAEDVFARFGGEEFVVLVRGIEHANVGRFAERLRVAVEQLEIAAEQSVTRVTISLGYASLAELEAEQRSPDGLLRLADARLYRSKQEGRNRATGA